MTNVPTNEAVFYVELGKSTLAHTYSEHNLTPPGFPDKWPAQRFFNTGMEWCDSNYIELRNVGYVLRLARLEKGQENASFSRSFKQNLSGVKGSEGIKTFLEDPQSAYFLGVVEEGMKLKGGKLKDFLDMMQRIVAAATP